MVSKILTSLVIYLLLHHTQKCVSSDPNLVGSTVGSGNKDPEESVDSESQNPKTSESEQTEEVALIQLNIKNEKETEQYNYSKNDINDTATFTAKEGYGFSKVVDKKGSLDCFGSDKDVWEASDDKEYATKVTRDGTGTFQSIKTVHIYFPKYAYKKFEKHDKNWVETMSRGSLEIHTDGSTNPNDTSKYEYVEGENGKKREFNFKTGTKCVELKYNDKTVWKYNKDKAANGYPRTVMIWEEQNIMINFEKGNVTCEKNGNEWKTNEFFASSRERVEGMGSERSSGGGRP